jgi:pyruvate ferredoxin oxidoreductase gamma subunit
MKGVKGMGVKEIRWHARAGQGAKTAAQLFAEAALGVGKFIQAFPEFGPERRGAPMQAFDRVSDSPIHIHSAVENPSVVVILDETIIGTVDVLKGLPPDGMIILNTKASPEEIRERYGIKGRRIFTVDASQIAMDLFKRDLSSVPMLGALAFATGLMSLEELIEDSRRRLEKKFKANPQIIQANIEAIRRGYEELKAESAPPQEEVEEVEEQRFLTWKELNIGGIIPEGGSSARYKTGGWRVERPILNKEKCINCLLCWISCPEGAIKVQDGKIAGIDLDYCKGCGICAVECPPKVKAIDMVPEKG